MKKVILFISIVCFSIMLFNCNNAPKSEVEPESEDSISIISDTLVLDNGNISETHSYQVRCTFDDFDTGDMIITIYKDNNGNCWCCAEDNNIYLMTNNNGQTFVIGDERLNIQGWAYNIKEKKLLVYSGKAYHDLNSDGWSCKEIK